MSKYVPRRRTVAIMQGDDADRLADLQRQIILAEQRASSDTARGEDGDAAALREEYEQAKVEAAENAIAVDVGYLPAPRRKGFIQLIAAHPPREGNDDDQATGYNVETFPVALLVKCCEVDDCADEDARAELFDDLPPGELDRLFELAWRMHTEPNADPKAPLSSPPSRSLTAT